MEQLSVFKGFSPEQLAALRPLFTFFYMPEGTVLFQQGEQAECFFILVDGEVAVRYKPEDGPMLVIARVRSEGVVGWSATIGSPQYTSSAVCLTECKVLRVRSANMRTLNEIDPQTGSMFLERLAALIEARLRSNHPQLMTLLEQSLAIRLDRPATAG
jgi:CRP-like cAMP-binding protein